MTFTEEQVLALAPDDASRKSGKDLAAPSKWVSRGRSGRSVWGACQGSGSKPYQTAVDAQNLAFKCSCPSRKFPCKHGIGLLLQYARQPGAFETTGEPAWVGEWLDKRTEREEKKSADTKPVNEAAQAKRLQAREQSVSDGIGELLLWMKDILRHGILTMPEKDVDFFESMARRMVDAKAPGLAGMVRELGEISFFREGWQTELMDGLARLYLVISGYQHSSSLPEALLQDVRSAVGFTVSQEALKEQGGITDSWLVLGKQVSMQDGLTTERYWLYGTQTGRYALILQFIARGQTGQLVLTPGMAVTAELVYFPSALPLRAIIRQQTGTATAGACTGLQHWQEVVQEETQGNSRLPFRRERPYIIERLRPVWHKGQWWLQDEQEALMPVKTSYTDIWKLLAVSGGNWLRVAVVGSEQHYEPLGAWHNGAYLTL